MFTGEEYSVGHAFANYSLVRWVKQKRAPLSLSILFPQICWVTVLFSPKISGILGIDCAF